MNTDKNNCESSDNGNSKNTSNQANEISVDKNNLYIVETFTDIGFVTISRFTPIKVDGSQDCERRPLFKALAQLQTSSGMIPLQVDLDVLTLEDAIDRIPAEMKKAYDEARKDFQFRQEEMFKSKQRIIQRMRGNLKNNSETDQQK